MTSFSILRSCTPLYDYSERSLLEYLCYFILKEKLQNQSLTFSVCEIFICFFTLNKADEDPVMKYKDGGRE